MRTASYTRFELLLSSFLLLACAGLWGYNYGAGRSLFLDEANLALNIAERSWGGFFRSLDHEQYAPPLFLLLVKAACELVGYSVWGLRLVPLLAGWGTLGLAWRLPEKLGTPVLRPLLLGLLLANEYTLRYFTEGKQYGFDLFVALGLLSLALAQPGRITRRWTVSWTLVGTLAVWSSMPSIFVLAGIGSQGLWRARMHGKGAMAWLAIGTAWLLSFALYYGLILRSDSQQSALANWHQPYFFPLLPQSAEDWQRAGGLLFSLLRTGFGHTFWVQLVAGSSVLAGVGIALAKKRRLAIYTLVPTGLAILASGLALYSLIPRLLLFAFPLLWALSLTGTQAAVDRSGRYGLPLAGLIWGLALLGSRNPITTPVRYDTTRELLAQLAFHAETPTYISQFAGPAVRYYQQWHPATTLLPVALRSRPLRYETGAMSALARLLNERPASAELLHSHPNPELARQYLLTARRKLEQAGYEVQIAAEYYNGWVVRVHR